MGWRVLLPLLMLACGVLATPSQSTVPTPGMASPDIRDIRGPLPARGPLPFVLTGGVLLLVGGLFLVRRMHRRAEVAPPSPAAVPRADAHDLLARLVADYRQGACPNDRIVIRVDEIMRGALAASCEIPARRLTSAELRAEAATCLGNDARARLGELLSLGDRVKFAGHSPDRAEIDRALNGAASLLDELRQGRGA